MVVWGWELEVCTLWCWRSDIYGKVGLEVWTLWSWRSEITGRAGLEVRTLW